MAERRITGPVNNPGRNGLVKTGFGSSAAATTTTTLTPHDNTIPQSDEGAEMFTLVYTPYSSANELLITVVAFAGTSNGGTGGAMCVALHKDSDADAIAASWTSAPTGDEVIPLVLVHRIATAGSGARTYKVRVGYNLSGTTTLNGDGGGRIGGGVMVSSIVVEERSV